jgi:hypothetical protein
MVMDRYRGDDMGAAPMRQLHREEKRKEGQLRKVGRANKR